MARKARDRVKGAAALSRGDEVVLGPQAGQRQSGRGGRSFAASAARKAHSRQASPVYALARHSGIREGKAPPRQFERYARAFGVRHSYGGALRRGASYEMG